MKKLFTLAAAALCTVAANAALDFTYTATPEAGTVTELSTIEVVFPNCAEIEFADKNSITLTHDGETVSMTPKISYGTNAMTITCAERQTAAGAYTLTLPAGCITAYDAEFNTEDLPSEITINYTIEGGAADAFNFTVNPEPGVVKELSVIKFNFPSWALMDVPNPDDVTFTCNGVPVPFTVESSYVAPTITVTADATQTAPGTYVVTFPAGSIDGFGSDDSMGTSTKEITAEWTIEGDVTTLDFSNTSVPANGNVAESFDKAVITFPGLDTVKASDYTVSVNGTALAADAFTLTENANEITVALNEAVTESVIDINFPAGSLAGTKGEAQSSNADEIAYQFIAGTAVDYALTAEFNNPKPNAEGEISNDRQIDAWFFYCPAKNIVADPNATEPNVTIREVNGDWVRTATLDKAYGLNMNYSYFMAQIGAPTYNGEYEVTISKGAFGDAVWAANHEYGHSNDEIVLHFTFVDARDRVVYNLVPTVTPIPGTYKNAADFATVTLSFPEEGVKALENASATLVNADADYNQTANFIQNEDGTFSATFPTPSVNGVYTLSVEQGIFGDNDFVSSNGLSGRGNAALTEEYTLDDMNGVELIESDAAANGVYSITGVRMGNSTENLPAGIYIVNGKKLVIK